MPMTYYKRARRNPEMTPTLGVMGTSRNEQRLLVIGGLVLAGLLYWKANKK